MRKFILQELSDEEDNHGFIRLYNSQERVWPAAWHAHPIAKNTE
jgi:hypothetical protein